MKLTIQLQGKRKTVFKFKDSLQRIWTALPQKSIAKGVKDFRKLLEAFVSADGENFENSI